jgi:hypothetical protein
MHATRVPLLCAALSGCLFAAPVGGQQAPTANRQIVVGPNHRASGDDTLSRNEGWISPSLKDPRVIVAAVQGPPGCHAMLSRDAGQVWQELNLPLLDDCFDPMTASATNGALYVLAGGRTVPGAADGRGGAANAITSQIALQPVRVYTSFDNGKTWRPPVALRTPVRPDHPRMAVDESNGPHRGRVYVEWNEVTDTWLKNKYHIWLNVSDDSGKTFSEPMPIEVDSGGKLVTTEPVILSDGTLLVTYYQYFQPLSSPKNLHQPFYIIRSSDGGRTFNRPEKAFEIGQSGWLAVRADFGRAFTLPIIVADQWPGSRYRDHVYAVWDDANSGDADIWFTSSADGGRTWSPKRRVNDNKPTAKDAPIDFRMTPVVSVNRNGVVGVAWYDRREDPAHRCWKYYFSASYDGGATFTPNVPVSSVASCPAKEAAPRVVVRNAQPDTALPSVDTLDKLVAAGKSQDADKIGIALAERAARQQGASPEIKLSFNKDRNIWPGHYTGLGPDSAGAFYAMWSDRRSGRQQSYVARIDVSAGDDPELATAREQVVTTQVEIVPGKAEVDEEKGTGTFSVEIRNVGQYPIYGPLRLRAKRISTPGALETKFIGAEPGGQGAVASWDFTSLMGSRKRLDPNVATEPRTIVLKLSPAGGLDAGFDFEVVGRVPARVASTKAATSLK